MLLADDATDTRSAAISNPTDAAQGTLDIEDTTAQTCTIDVPAPGFALVFLTDDGDIADSGREGRVKRAGRR
jgi:hypothetical protein